MVLVLRQDRVQVVCGEAGPAPRRARFLLAAEQVHSPAPILQALQWTANTLMAPPGDKYT